MIAAIYTRRSSNIFTNLKGRVVKSQHRAPHLPEVTLLPDPSDYRQNIPTQFTVCRDYATGRGWSVGPRYDYIARVGAQQRSRERFAPSHIIADAKLRRWEVLVVYSLDRWAETSRDLAVQTTRLLATGRHLASIRENIDTTAMSESEREALKLTFAALVLFEDALAQESIDAGESPSADRYSAQGPTVELGRRKITLLTKLGLTPLQIANLGGVGVGKVKSALKMIDKEEGGE